LVVGNFPLLRERYKYIFLIGHAEKSFRATDAVKGEESPLSAGGVQPSQAGTLRKVVKGREINRPGKRMNQFGDIPRVLMGTLPGRRKSKRIR
jgi:hypothetical protein